MIIVPIVHMNGDTKQTLVDNLKVVYTALKNANKALAEATPNGRNYYLVDGLYEKAMQQHKSRQVQLKLLIDSIVDEVKAIDETYPTER